MRSVALLALIAGCSAAPPARRYVVVASPDGRAVPDCRDLCRPFAKPGETTSCEGAALRPPLDEELGANAALVCIVGAEAR